MGWLGKLPGSSRGDGAGGAERERAGLCLRAANCDECFASGRCCRAWVDVAQPRRVGDGYWTARPRVLVLSGAEVHAFAGPGREALPGARLIPTPHYAHRSGRELSEAVRTDSRLRLLVGVHYRLIDTRCKEMLDTLRIGAARAEGQRQVRITLLDKPPTW